ncbi:pentatricopeptide repeat-containing protein, partial [Trifolium medium]|nr:pentatricopeptide repeat-containing protein [Trifolium medium]
NTSPTSSLNSTGRKSDGDRRSGSSDRWRGMRNEEMEERRAKGLCFKCGDSGASHSFISPELATALGLTVTPTTVKRIKLGDGHRVMSEVRRFRCGSGCILVKHLGESYYGLERFVNAILA